LESCPLKSQTGGKNLKRQVSREEYVQNLPAEQKTAKVLAAKEHKVQQLELNLTLLLEYNA